MKSIHLQPAVMCFAFQRKVDQGEVVDWPIELMHPSKCNLKIDSIYYKEIIEFCKNTYDIDVYIYILGWTNLGTVWLMT